MTLTASVVVGLAITWLLAEAVRSMFWSRKRSLAGKHVLITGGSKGIGLAMAKAAVSRGCKVTILARNKRDLAGAEALLAQQAAAQHSQEARVHSVQADTTDAEQVMDVRCVWDGSGWMETPGVARAGGAWS